MGKIQAGISIDDDVWQDIKKLYAGQISQKVEDYFIRLINFSKSDVEGIEIYDLEKELNKQTNNQTEIIVKIQELRDRIDILRIQQQEKEQAQIDKEKDEAMQMVTCIHCKIPKHAEKMHKTSDDDMLCNGCYLSLPPEDIKQYFKK